MSIGSDTVGAVPRLETNRLLALAGRVWGGPAASPTHPFRGRRQPCPSWPSGSGEILDCAAAGLSNAQIGKQMFLSAAGTWP